MAISRKKSHKDMTEYDVNMAWELQRTYNTLGLTENAVFPEHKECENYKPRTLIDHTLEIIDPTPNIYTLFSQFNVRFFSNKLLSVEVKWSQRMTSCAGVCSFQPRSRDCVISLSAPLLKLRPRKDLVETLLHEMIHGYLFLTNNNRDRDGHGPEFCKIMNRINQEAGTNISIYHSFHDEVRLYQQHWWRCNGPCQKRPPYFGTVRRAMNRAPGPSDFWWQAHQQSCDGTFIKIREPEKKPPRSKSRNPGYENPKLKKASPTEKPDKILDDWLTKPGRNIGIPGSTNGTNFTQKNSGSSNVHVQSGKPVPAGLVKLGTSTNNVHGWGTGGPKTSSSRTPNFSKDKTNSDKSRSPMINFTGTIGGNNTGRSNLLDKFSSPTISHRPTKNRGSYIIDDSPPAKKTKVASPKTEISQNPPNGEFYNCPVCNSMIAANLFNDHLDFCLVKSGSNQGQEKPSLVEILDSPEKNRGPSKTKTPLKGQTNLESFVQSPKKNIVSCPACNKSVPMERLYDHLDRCSFDDREMGSTSFPGYENPGPSATRKEFVDLTEEATHSRKDYRCLVCNVMISSDIALKDHLDECVQAIFNDDTFDVGNESLEIIDSPKNEPPIEKFPCPICMDMIRESMMNEHLDKCLASQNYD